MASAYGGKGPLMLGVTWAEAGLAIILVSLRAKHASVASSGKVSVGLFGLRWDCLWAIIAMISALLAQSLMTVSVSYGLGNHESLLSPYNIVKTNLWSWIAQIVAIFTLVVARFAVIAFLLALSDRTHRHSRWVLYLVGGLQAIINFVEIVLILQQCTPIQKLWDPTIPGTCALIGICSQVGFLQGSIGAFADLLLAFYPIYVIGPLKQKWKVKLSLCAIMGGGLIAGIAGINKTIAIASITQTSDITYAIYALNTWVLTEMWFILIFGSIPVLRLFFLRLGQTTNKGSNSTFNNAPRSGHLNLSRNPNDNWVPLGDRSDAHAMYDSSTKDPSRAERGETRPEDSREDRIMVTHETQVKREDMA